MNTKNDAPAAMAAIDIQQPTALPIFLCLPDRVKGMPILREIRPLAADKPDALFQENEKPCFFPITGDPISH